MHKGSKSFLLVEMSSVAEPRSNHLACRRRCFLGNSYGLCIFCGLTRERVVMVRLIRILFWRDGDRPNLRSAGMIDRAEAPGFHRQSDLTQPL
jgi:hypothetical protein